MKIIFLDIDGVLNTSSSRGSLQADGLKQTCLDLLNTLLAERSDIQVVIISTWLRWQKVHDIVRMIQLPIRRFAGSINPDLGKPRGIAQWLKEHPTIKDFLVVDDHPIEGYEDKQVWIFGDVGLTSHDVTAIMERL